MSDNIEVMLLRVNIAKLHEDYSELLDQVQNTHPNETRHETAKRIIHQHENRQSNGPEQAIKENNDE